MIRLEALRERSDSSRPQKLLKGRQEDTSRIAVLLAGDNRGAAVQEALYI